MTFIVLGGLKESVCRKGERVLTSTNFTNVKTGIVPKTLRSVQASARSKKVFSTCIIDISRFSCNGSRDIQISIYRHTAYLKFAFKSLLRMPA